MSYSPNKLCGNSLTSTIIEHCWEKTSTSIEYCLCSKVSIQCASFLLEWLCINNRLPPALLNHKKPYELIFNQTPSYNHLKVFGSICFISTLSSHGLKFDLRDKTCVFLGYPFDFKDFKLLYINTFATFISHDVHFQEHIFPFHSFSDRVSSFSTQAFDQNSLSSFLPTLGCT